MTQGVRTAAQAAKDVVVFKALANPVRLQIVSLVAASGEGQVSAGQIVERFSLSQPTISHHLRVLREAGILTTFKTSTFVYYRFAPQLRETVSAVLPDAAAAEPPAETHPVRKTSAPRSRKAPAGKAASTKAASRPATQTDDSNAPQTAADPALMTPASEPVDAGPVMPVAEPVDSDALDAAQRHADADSDGNGSKHAKKHEKSDNHKDDDGKKHGKGKKDKKSKKKDKKK